MKSMMAEATKKIKDGTIYQMMILMMMVVLNTGGEDCMSITESEIQTKGKFKENIKLVFIY